MEQTLTKKEAIRRHLENNVGITSKEAFELYGETRLSATIYELKHRNNLNIISEDTKVKTRYGKNVCVTTYKLVEGTHHETY